MKAEWKDIEFVFVQYKDTGLSILSAVDDLQVYFNTFLSVLCPLFKLLWSSVSIERRSVTSRYHGHQISGSQR